jgi:hypothetical protein
MPAGSRVPSRPVTPCRQTKLKELLGQIDGKLDPAETPAMAASLLSSGVVRYRNLLEMIERSGCLAGCPPGDREELLSAVLGQSASSSKWVLAGIHLDSSHFDRHRLGGSGRPSCTMPWSASSPTSAPSRPTPCRSAPKSARRRSRTTLR